MRFNLVNLIVNHLRCCFQTSNTRYPEFRLSKYICFLEEGKHNRANMWLTCGLLKNAQYTPEEFIKNLESDNIESRFIWKPMHQQPILKTYPSWKNIKGGDYLFKRGICLPSGSSLTDEDLARIVKAALHYFLGYD